MSKKRQPISKKHKNKRSSKTLITPSKTHIGVMDISGNGNGYVLCAEMDMDVFVAQSDLNTAQNGDEVEVNVFFRKGKSKPFGKIKKVLKRKKYIFTGVLHLTDEEMLVSPTTRKMSNKIVVKAVGFENLKDKDKVVVRITHWSDNTTPHKGEVIDVLGAEGEHHAEMKGILVESGLPYNFPKEVEDYVHTLDITISEEEVRKRRDMREVLTFTIDPKDAKDFDDALSFEYLDNGNYQIGIHIADVSHYLRPNTILDDEAYTRATSIYLVDRVVPMLPEVLSNGVCSLRPLEDKYTFSVIVEINAQAKIVKKWFGRTVTRSDKRFAYEEAQQVIDTKQGYIPDEVSLDGKSYDVAENVVKAILDMNQLAISLRQRRMTSGALSFDKIEVKFVLDEQHEPKGVLFKETKQANHMIEEFMLLANKSVAEYIGKEKKGLCIYRVHDQPDIEKLQALQGIVGKLGYSLNLKNHKQLSNSLNKLLEEVKGNKSQHLVDTLAIRSMSKAEYSVNNIGHYGLAFDYYTHFTSPIRRYPDVMVHRILQQCLDGKLLSDIEVYEKRCKHCSQMESVAVGAERDSTKYMQIRFLEIHKKSSYKGIISGVTDRGIYIEISENKCEGLVRLKDIETDYYYYDPKTYSIVGKKYHKIYQLGDEVEVSVKSLNLEKRHINLLLVD